MQANTSLSYIIDHHRLLSSSPSPSPMIHPSMGAIMLIDHLHHHFCTYRVFVPDTILSTRRRNLSATLNTALLLLRVDLLHSAGCDCCSPSLWSFSLSLPCFSSSSPSSFTWTFIASSEHWMVTPGTSLAVSLDISLSSMISTTGASKGREHVTWVQ